MKKKNFTRYFRVYSKDTAVTEISANDFRPPKLKPVKKDWFIANTNDIYDAIASVVYSLPEGEPLFYGYTTRVRAMEMAKAGALRHINSLIDLGEAGEQQLLQYRTDHFEDLEVNLVYANIESVRAKSVPVPDCSEYVSKKDWV